MKLFSCKAQRLMERQAKKGEWVNLIEIARITDFAAWLSNDAHGWTIQSPDAKEVLRAWRHGRTIVVGYDGKRTRCGRHVMALWLTFLCFS